MILDDMVLVTIILMRIVVGWFSGGSQRKKTLREEHRRRLDDGPIESDEWTEAWRSIPPGLSRYDARQLEKSDV